MTLGNCEKYRGKVQNEIKPTVEYGICLNKQPDYITGCAVTKTEIIEEVFIPYTIPPGKYIKDTFNAESFEKLTCEAMAERNVKVWAKANKVKINSEYIVEVYPKETLKEDNFEMYTLTPIKE